MGFLRRAAFASMLSLFTTTLFTLGFVVGVWMVVSDASTIKEVLAKSGVYATLPKDALSQAAQKQETQNIPLSQPDIQALVEGAFPASTLEKSANEIIDGMYGWVQGKTAQPQFSVDLQSSKQTLAESMGSYVQQRITALPVCTTLPTGEIDPFTITCRPANLDPTAAGNQAKNDILNSKELLADPVLTPQSFKDAQGQPIINQVQNAPQLYENMTLAVYGLFVVIALTGVVVVALAGNWRIGLRRVAVAMMSVGIISAIVAWIGTVLIEKGIGSALTSSQDSLIQGRVVEIIRLLSLEVRQYWLITAVTTAVLGFIIWLLCRTLLKEPPQQNVLGAQPIHLPPPQIPREKL